MAKHTRRCYCCGNSYDYCPNCRQYISQPKWRALYDNEKCKEIFNVLSGYYMKLNTKEDVQRVVDTYNITDFSEFKPNIEKQLKEILKEDKSINNTETLSDVLVANNGAITSDNVESLKDDNRKNTNKRKRNKYNDMDIELNNDNV